MKPNPPNVWPGTGLSSKAARLDGDEPGQHGVPRPAPESNARPNGVEALTHVSSFARRDQVAGSERHFLSPDPQAQQVWRRPGAELRKHLVDLEPIFIGRPRAARAACLESALKLGEHANMSTGAQIGMDEIPLQCIAIGVLRS